MKNTAAATRRSALNRTARKNEARGRGPAIVSVTCVECEATLPATAEAISAPCPRCNFPADRQPQDIRPVSATVCESCYIQFSR